MLKAILLLSPVLSAACVVGDSTPVPISRADECPANTPAALAPPATETLAFSLAATGVQKYTCTSSGWTFVAPQADLIRDDEIVGEHFAGPTWEYEDGSSVVGAKVAAATVDATAIPWLLLKATSHGGPEGKMTTVTSIQRLVTTTGLAPATGCDAAHLNAKADVAYTATYFFYRAAEGTQPTVRCGG